MTNSLASINLSDKIHLIRGKQVILDSDLAFLYGVDVKRLNEQVKRNISRFPNDFMFKLSVSELSILRSQFATSSLSHGGRRYLPRVFTEQGVAMLSGILRSQTAIDVNIQIMRAFVNMRHFISTNLDLFSRVSSLEEKYLIHDTKFKKIFDKILENELSPSQGIFFDGQIFDAYSFVSKLVCSADKRIVLIDNYIDDSVLTLLSKNSNNIQIEIYSKNISKQLNLDVEKYNNQYSNLSLKKFKKSHDRFLIIDDDIYHFGASLKDLGKRWFAFSKLNLEINIILSNLS